MLSILPFWIFPRFPLGDNLTHSYNRTSSPGNTRLRPGTTRRTFFGGGNALYYLALLPAALAGINTVVAEKVLFSINALLHFVSLAYAVTARQKRLAFAFCAPFFVFSYPFLMGSPVSG